ncbi:MAG TPA: serine/threonine-protein kinase, partial [Polyangiales bacterium]
MAEIVKARDTASPNQRLVAIKRILPHLTDDEQYKAMFMDESRVLAQLDHASVIQAFEIGEIEGTPYIALEYVDGQDGRALFEEARRLGQRIPIGLACFIIARVCEGLHHAHEQTDANGQMLGIVHRDVSLQNILVSYDGDVKLTDFGIAVSAENIARTDVGVVKGKFGYMSPEQIKGAALDRRSDVFAAGICLYELLTSERLFSGENDYKAVERVRNVDVEPPSKWNRQIPSGLEQIVLKALAKQPRDRYQSTNDLRRALQTFMSGVNEFVDRTDLAAYLRKLFAEDLATGREPRPAPAGDAITAAQPATHDAVTGLNAFDDLEPVSAMRLLDPEERPLTSPTRHDSGMLELPMPKRSESRSPFRETLRPGANASAVHRPSVPPIIPLAESIPASIASRSPSATVPEQARRFEMDWDEEEPTTVSQGFADDAELPVRPREIAHEAEASEPKLAAIGGEIVAPPSPHPPPPRVRSIPTLEFEHPRSMFGPGIVAGLFAASAIALAFYLAHDRGVARLRLYTEPKDAIARIDGKPASGESPFEFSDVAA